MKIDLRKITMDNFHECIRLAVDADQENFVASNMYSLAEAKADEVSMPYAVYAGEDMVGFVMYDYEPKKQMAYITRLMIDQRYQGKGYGRQTMEEIMGRIRQIDGCQRVHISYAQQNDAARKLYESLGFVKTGEIDEGEIVCELEI